MRIGIIGSGNMGRALGVRFAQLGHEVAFGARRPEQAQEAATLAAHAARAGTNDEAASFGELLLWTMRESDPGKVLTEAGSLDGKIVVDLNNRDYAAARDGAWFERASAELLQAAAPRARVVKAFNTIAMEAFDTAPEALREAGAQTFLAGDDAAAKAAVAGLARELGFDAVDAGGIRNARAVEAMGDVIRLLMIDGGHGWRVHLRLVTLPEASLGAIGARAASTYG